MENLLLSICLISISKIIEKLYLSQLNVYLKDHNLMANEQHGFRKGHSIFNAINELMEFCTKNRLDNNITSCTYIDLQKAFDTVEHPALIKKLTDRFNFGNTAINWIVSFLSNRTQACNFLGNISNPLPTLAGVPQGSVLGPVLFSLYLNDCREVVQSAKLLLYADDTAFLCSENSIPKTIQKTEENLYYMNLWYKRNKLTMNAKKSKFSVFNRPNTVPLALLPNNLVVEDKSLGYAKVYTYLGLDIDDEFSFEQQLKKVIRSCAYRTGQLSRVRCFL